MPDQLIPHRIPTEHDINLVLRNYLATHKGHRVDRLLMLVHLTENRWSARFLFFDAHNSLYEHPLYITLY